MSDLTYYDLTIRVVDYVNEKVAKDARCGQKYLVEIETSYMKEEINRILSDLGSEDLIELLRELIDYDVSYLHKELQQFSHLTLNGVINELIAEELCIRVKVNLMES